MYGLLIKNSGVIIKTFFYDDFSNINGSEREKKVII